jgi:multicomponent Na+:H+ antiporter subunit E
MSLVRKPLDTAVLLYGFGRDLVLSSVQVARAVLMPGETTAPRFCVVRLTAARSGTEITIVANYITLTPGTLTVDVSPDRSALLVHSLLAGGESDTVCDDIRDIETKVTRVTR